MKFEQLYREERAKNESLFAQKQALTVKLNQIQSNVQEVLSREEDLKASVQNS